MLLFTKSSARVEGVTSARDAMRARDKLENSKALRRILKVKIGGVNVSVGPR